MSTCTGTHRHHHLPAQHAQLSMQLKEGYEPQLLPSGQQISPISKLSIKQRSNHTAAQFRAPKCKPPANHFWNIPFGCDWLVLVMMHQTCQYEGSTDSEAISALFQRWLSNSQQCPTNCQKPLKIEPPDCSTGVCCDSGLWTGFHRTHVVCIGFEFNQQAVSGFKFPLNVPAVISPENELQPR